MKEEEKRGRNLGSGKKEESDLFSLLVRLISSETFGKGKGRGSRYRDSAIQKEKVEKRRRKNEGVYILRCTDTWQGRRKRGKQPLIIIPLKRVHVKRLRHVLGGRATPACC